MARNDATTTAPGRWRLRVLGWLDAVLAAAALGGIGVAAAYATEAVTQSAFDDASLPSHALPGEIIRFETLPTAPKGATAFLFLYASTGLDEKLRAVSGVIFVPDGAAPAGGRNIVAWAHPTTGVAPGCAPSLRAQVAETAPGLEQFLAAGDVVVATDYPGLGTVGPHPYLVGVSEGRAVLDSVRAAEHFPQVGAGRRFAVGGHSQGGHAALFAGQLARRYAPELSLAGIAVAAPASDLAKVMKNDIGSPIRRILTA